MNPSDVNNPEHLNMPIDTDFVTLEDRIRRFLMEDRRVLEKGRRERDNSRGFGTVRWFGRIHRWIVGR